MDSAVRSVLKAIGIKKKSPIHAFRHTVATRLLEAGVPVNQVAAQLGNTVETIVRTYVKEMPPSQEDIDRAYEVKDEKKKDDDDGIAAATSYQTRIRQHPQYFPLHARSVSNLPARQLNSRS